MTWNQLPEGYVSPGFVIVTMYAPEGKPPYVHVYGMYETRAKAMTEVRSDLKRMEEAGEDISQLQWWIRKVSDIPQMNRLLEKEQEDERARAEG